MKDSTQLRIPNLRDAMNDKSAPLNTYFHAKFAEVEKQLDLKWTGDSQALVKEIAYLFYLQGQAHARKWHDRSDDQAHA